MRLEDHIKDISDFPKPGIVFKDITPLFLDHEALRFAVDQLADYALAGNRTTSSRPRRAASCWARGVAVAAGAGFILAQAG